MQNRHAFETVRAHKAEMLNPEIVTARLAGLSLAPWHSGQA